MREIWTWRTEIEQKKHVQLNDFNASLEVEMGGGDGIVEIEWSRTTDCWSEFNGIMMMGSNEIEKKKEWSSNDARARARSTKL